MYKNLPCKELAFEISKVVMNTTHKNNNNSNFRRLKSFIFYIKLKKQQYAKLITRRQKYTVKFAPHYCTIKQTSSFRRLGSFRIKRYNTRIRRESSTAAFAHLRLVLTSRSLNDFTYLSLKPFNYNFKNSFKKLIVQCVLHFEFLFNSFY